MKMKLSVEFSFGCKMLDTFFYLLGEADAEASEVFSIYLGSLMQEYPGRHIIP